MASLWAILWEVVLRSRRYGWYVLGLFAVLNFVSYANRNVVLAMYDDLRAEFQFDNADLGLLTTYYMVFHALAAVPSGWAADRFDRRRVIGIGVAVWSFGALACALATDRGNLFAGRALAGLGTGALVPVANALLCDVFPPASKARTISVFNIGLFLGGACGFGVGLVGYPLAVFIVALPGFVLAWLVATVQVPARRPRVDVTAERMTLRAFASDCVALAQVRTLRYILLGSICLSFAAGSLLAWFVDFVQQTKSLSLGTATTFFGVSVLTAGLAGVVTGGAVGDVLYRRRAYGRLAAISLGLAGAVPFGLIALYVDSGPMFFVAAWLMMFFIPWYHGPMAAVVDDVVPDERAATAQAVLIGLMHLIGTAPSAWIVGVVADETGVRTAMLVPTAALTLGAAAFTGGWSSIAADRARAAAR